MSVAAGTVGCRIVVGRNYHTVRCKLECSYVPVEPHSLDCIDYNSAGHTAGIPHHTAAVAAAGCSIGYAEADYSLRTVGIVDQAEMTVRAEKTVRRAGMYWG